MRTAHGVKLNPPDFAEILRFREMHLLSWEDTHSFKPVIFLATPAENEQPTLALFDVEHMTVYVMGRRQAAAVPGMDVSPGQNHDWHTWGGPAYWKRVTALLEWTPASSNTPKVIVLPCFEVRGLICSQISLKKGV